MNNVVEMKENVKDWGLPSSTAIDKQTNKQKKPPKSQPADGKENTNMLCKIMEASFKILAGPHTAKHLHILKLYFCIRFLFL